MKKYILTISCPDRPGIVAEVATKLFANGGNIIEAQQFDDSQTGHFFMRIEFTLTQPPQKFETDFAATAASTGCALAN